VPELGLAALIVLSALVAAWRGGNREWLGVVIVAGVSAASLLMAHDSRVHVEAWSLLALDCAALLVLGKLSWKAPRQWPVWVMAPQAMAAASSVAFLLDASIGAETYSRALMMARYVAALLLLLGICRSAQAQP